LPIALQFVTFDAEQRALLKKVSALPPHIATWQSPTEQPPCRANREMCGRRRQRARKLSPKMCETRGTSTAVPAYSSGRAVLDAQWCRAGPSASRQQASRRAGRPWIGEGECRGSRRLTKGDAADTLVVAHSTKPGSAQAGSRVEATERMAAMSSSDQILSLRSAT
jgi:hypothetical protein